MITAVLAVFLVLALFAGAGAAATVYVYQYNGTGLNYSATPTTWSLMENGYPSGAIAESDSNGTIAQAGLTEGVYSNNSSMLGTLINLKYPAITLNGYLAGTGTSIAGSTVLKIQDIDFAVSGDNGLNYSLSFTTPAGGSTSTFGDTVFTDGNASVNLTNVPLTNVTSGTWSVKAKFETETATDYYLIKTTPSKYLSSAALSFTVGGSTTDSIAVNKDTIIRGNSILLTVNGAPGAKVNVSVTSGGFTPLAGTGIVSGSDRYDDNGWLTYFNVTLGDSGSKTVQLDTNTSSAAKAYTIKAVYTDGSSKSTKVTVEKGAITVEAGQDSYYLGNDITLSGTNTESGDVYIFIKGANVDRQLITSANEIVVNDDDTWSFEFDPTSPSYAGSLDAGTYTFYATAGINASKTGSFDSDIAYASVSVSLKQPFLTATATSPTVAIGDKITITGNAEATDDLKYYVFGSNYYYTDTVSVNDDSTYSFDIETDGLTAGQYYLIVQHPMYDTYFNVMDVNPSNGPICLNATNEPTASDEVVVAVADRQKANAAAALKAAIDRESIDDIYVPLEFKVAQPTLTMNSVSDVAKGSTLSVSGTTNYKAGTVITVDVLSTAFTAVEKTSVSSASFITMTAKAVAGTNGVNTWSVTFDTSGLNVDSYTIQASVDDLSTSTIIKVTEAAPTKTATTTATATKTATATATATPTTTPGFGAFLALAGLGAVAVLVLRRN